MRGWNGRSAGSASGIEYLHPRGDPGQGNETPSVPVPERGRCVFETISRVVE